MNNQTGSMGSDDFMAAMKARNITLTASPPDPLGPSLQHIEKGEADVEAGRYRLFFTHIREAIRVLRGKP